MFQFEHFIPIKFIFGREKIKKIGKETAKYGKKALIVTGRNSTKKSGLLFKVEELLNAEGVEYAVFDKVISNPLITTVEEGVNLLKKEKCDVVIGLGGGSPMDTAKGIAFAAVNDGPLTEYIYGKKGEGALPVIAVTTTAGTGSEGDRYAVFTNNVNNDKKSLQTPDIYPKVAIIDPELMITQTPSMIASTGFDALCHCIEAYLSKRSTPVSEMISLTGIRMLGENLPRVYKDPMDLESWDKVALANTFGGIAIDFCGVALPHALEHPVSGLLNVAHGEGLAALIEPTLQFSLDFSLEKFKNIAEALGENTASLSCQEAADRAVEKIVNLKKELGLTKTLKDFGVKTEYLDWLADNAVKTMSYAISNNPAKANLEEIKELFKKAL